MRSYLAHKAEQEVTRIQPDRTLHVTTICRSCNVRILLPVACLLLSKECAVRRSDVVVLAVILTLGTVSNAEAYMDPGSGALLWQTLLAAAMGATFYFRRVLRWFKRDNSE